MFKSAKLELESQGCHVQVKHFRNVLLNGTVVRVTKGSIPDRAPYTILPNGGITVVSVTYPDGHTVDEYARCNEKDNFSKRIGREVAMGRLYKRVWQDK